jgi:hypothetical protein
LDADAVTGGITTVLDAFGEVLLAPFFGMVYALDESMMTLGNSQNNEKCYMSARRSLGISDVMLIELLSGRGCLERRIDGQRS